MWRKREQYKLWVVAYFPLLMFMVYEFFDSKGILKETKFAEFLRQYIDKNIFDVTIVLLILLVSFLLYRWIVNYLFKDYETKLRSKNFGQTYYVRNFETLSANDYSFFLITLLLPLVSLDYSSTANITVSILIMFFIIQIFVKTGSISFCPVFFLSNRNVFRGTISNIERELEGENPSARKEIFIITKHAFLDLNYSFKVIKLVKNVYYIVQLDEDED